MRKTYFMDKKSKSSYKTSLLLLTLKGLGICLAGECQKLPGQAAFGTAKFPKASMMKHIDQNIDLDSEKGLAGIFHR